MISSGLFILPGLAHAQAGPAVVFSYFLAGVLAMTGMLSVAEIITAMPKAGGDYFFITRTMGPAAGTVSGLLIWFSLTLKSTFALFGISAFLELVIDLDPRLTGAIISILFLLVNIYGVKEAGKVQVVLVLGLFALMLCYIVLGAGSVQARYFMPFAPHGWHAVFSASGLVFVSFGGLLTVASVAEEIKDPGKVIPRAMILSLIVVSIFYTLMVFITSGVLSAERLDYSLTPISEGADIFLGPPGKIAMSLAAVLAFISTANAGVMTASRYLLSLSRDQLIPSFLGRINEKFQTPHNAIILTCLSMISALFLSLELLVKAASTVLILASILSNLSVIVLRESGLLNYQPKFRAPFYPWLQVAGIAGYGLLLLEMGMQALLVSFLLVLGGLFFFWFYGRVKQEREYALLHLIERITDKELSSGMLESELKDIIRERDELCIDQFDSVVEKALVIDLPKRMDGDTCFATLAQQLHEKFGFEEQWLKRSLKIREKTESTVLIPGIAVSDVMVEGKEFFEIVLVRCKEGIFFEESGENIYVFFLLLASKDQRRFYLRAIAAIAQIIGDFDFERKWLEAKSTEQLRDLILLGKRRRICIA